MKHLIRPALAGLFLTFALPALALTPTEAAKLLAGDGAAGDQFGFSVAMSGNTAIIGSRFDEDNGWRSGSAYVFVRESGGSWSEQAKLTPHDGGPGNHFGYAVAIEDDTAVIGANGHRHDGNSSSYGAAYVFVRDPAGNWSELTELAGTSASAFGVAVGLEGNTAVIGAIGSTGSAHVFVHDGSGNWSEQARLSASDGERGDGFGQSVAISESTILVGAPDDDLSGSSYVYVWDGTGQWNHQTKLVANDGVSVGRFGKSIDIDGDTVVIGAPTNSVQGINSGSAYVFLRDANGNWSQHVNLAASDGSPGDLFGDSVAVSSDVLLIGARRDDDLGTNSGSTYVFTRDGSGQWSEKAKVSASDGKVSHEFGEAVALSPPRAIVGAYGDDDNGAFSGSAYVLDLFSSDIDRDGVPDVSDPCPADPLDGCDVTGSAAGIVSSTGGGTVTTPDGNVAIEVEPGDLPGGSATISVTKTVFTDPEVDLSIGSTAGAGQAVSFYDIEPDGLDFTPNSVQLRLLADVTGLNPAQRSKLDIYRLEPDGSGGFAFVPLGATCSVVEDPVDTFTATCVVALDHFSTYGLIAPLDSDGDGIFDDFDGESDQCPAEDASGFDVDKDGCIDSIGGLSEMVSGLVEEGVIDEKMETSLLSKVDNAESSSTRDNICTAVNQLESFISHVQAQTGKKISEQSAADVIEYANSVIAHLEAGVSC